MRFLIRDRDRTCPAAFTTVFTAQAATIIRTPVQAPHAPAYAERWMHAVREACLDTMQIVSEGHLQRVLATYVDYDTHARHIRGFINAVPCRTAQRRGTDRSSAVLCWVVSPMVTLVVQRSAGLPRMNVFAPLGTSVCVFQGIGDCVFPRHCSPLCPGCSHGRRVKMGANHVDLLLIQGAVGRKVDLHANYFAQGFRCAE